MKLTNKQLRRLIKEELTSFLAEGKAADFLRSFELPQRGQPKNWDERVERKFADLEARGGLGSLSRKDTIINYLRSDLKTLRKLRFPDKIIFLKNVQFLPLEPEDGYFSVRRGKLQWSARKQEHDDEKWTSWFFWTSWDEKRKQWEPLDFQSRTEWWDKEEEEEEGWWSDY